MSVCNVHVTWISLIKRFVFMQPFQHLSWRLFVCVWAKGYFNYRIDLLLCLDVVDCHLRTTLNRRIFSS